MSVGIVGLGYVGLPLAVAFAEAGIDVVGVDVDAAKIADIRQGRSHVEDIPDERLRGVDGRILATTRLVEVHECDAVLVCVPTPLNANREPDLGPLLGATRALSGVIRAGQRSSSSPPPSRARRASISSPARGVRARGGAGLLARLLARASGPRSHDFTIRTTPKVVGGLTPACTERARQVYAPDLRPPRAVSTPEVAELSKLLENIFRSVNIALVNELAILADRMGIDIWEVVDAARPSRTVHALRAGAGMGGHCLPVDPFYLTWKAREYDMSTEFIELAGKVNKQMPYFCLEKIERALNDAAKAVRGARILISASSYKAGVGDLRESPALKILRLLPSAAARVSYHDPHIPELPTSDCAAARSTRRSRTSTWR
jgi:UDP-N-acetyl-D-glucosamine dehydrogenase